MQTIQTPSIGSVAYSWLNNCSLAEITGITSSGIFLRLTSRQIIFLTPANNPGPINLVVSSLPTSWQKQQPVQIKTRTSNVHFISNNEELSLTDFHVWHTPLPPVYRILASEQNRRIFQSAAQILTLKRNAGFSDLITPLLKMEKNHIPADPPMQKIWHNMIALMEAITQNDSNAFLQNATPLIGMGRGLTPSGDDALSGLLFTLQRMNSTTWLMDIGQQLVEIAFQRSPTVSACLMACALIGETDPRIHTLFDSLINEDIPFQNQAIQLARWGNSSGADTFLGILIALLPNLTN
ncbi:MAG: hypothetical protein CVU39_23550 [Chloroflexi bacterium HGW-Chloroflexi-10]|nr:MAG: hypothetical protein CVU39_23550 [Chloroflexi bacterium HGW-Chloroflexi-10]